MRLFQSFCLFVTLSSLILVLTTVQAETPTPSPTPSSFCEAASLQAGGTRVIGSVEVTLPEGTYNLTIPPPGTGGNGESNLLLCHKESGGFLNLNSTNCEENAREAPTAEAEAILNDIVASCRIAPTPTPAPPPILCPEGEPIAGGQTVTIEDSIEVTLPNGDFTVLVTGDRAQVCNRSEEYTLALSLSDCHRSDIEPPNAPAHDVMAQIVASCALLHPVTPAPNFPPLTEPGIITPPSTGSGGLVAGED